MLGLFIEKWEKNLNPKKVDISIKFWGFQFWIKCVKLISIMFDTCIIIYYYY